MGWNLVLVVVLLIDCFEILLFEFIFLKVCLVKFEIKFLDMINFRVFIFGGGCVMGIFWIFLDGIG